MALLGRLAKPCGLLGFRGKTATNALLCNGAKRLASSSACSLVELDTSNPNGFYVMSLNRPPVNSLSLELMNDIISTLDKVESESKGLVLTSSCKSTFCAGLDLTEMYNPEEQR